MTPIKNHKDICRELAPTGWQYGGFDNGYYLFQSGSYREGFKPMLLLECDLEPKNIAFMVKNNLTRMEGFKYD